MNAPIKFMLLVTFFVVARTANLYAQTTAPATQPVVNAALDPRPGLAAYFKAIRDGDDQAAFDCWLDDVGNDDDRKNVEELVHADNLLMIANAKYEDAMKAKLPADWEKRRQSYNVLPDVQEILTGKYTVYRRLAICKWGDDENDALPMVLDNRGMIQRLPPIWKISMQQWHETNNSSVGDSMLMSGWVPKATALTTQEILAGKFKNIDEVDEAMLQHLTDIADAADKADKAATTKP